MQTSTFKFILNLQKTQSQIAIPVTRGDNARTWCISFLDGRDPYEIAEGCLAKLEIKRPTGTHIEQFCPIENKSTVRYSFTQNPNTAAVEGLHDCQIILFDEQGNVIGSPRFSMIVSDRVIDNDDINLSDEDKLIIEAIITAEASRQSAEIERINAEAARISSEEQREQNESARQTAGTEYALAEENRGKRFEALQKDVNAALNALVSPTVTVVPTDSGHNVTVTSPGGDLTFFVANGKDGRNGTEGADGKTYKLTSADMTAIASKVSNAVFAEAPLFVDSRDEMTDTSKIYVLSSTGKMWAYKNVTVEQTVTDRVTDAFFDNTRLGSDGSNASGNIGYVTTPYIDLLKYPVPFVLHLEGAAFIPTTTESATRMCTYTSAKEKIFCGSHTNTSVDSFLNVSDSDVTIEDTNVVTISFTKPPRTNNDQDMQYVRFSGKGTSTTAAVYATYSTVVSGAQWFDTGLYYRPILTNAEKAEIAEEAASLIDSQLLSVIGSGEVSV